MNFRKARFIGQKIDVVTREEEPVPVSFTWKEREYHITTIVRTWQDHGFSQAAPVRNWRSRRHRNVFVVETDSGEHFQIYLDRGSGRKQWYLYESYEK